jgi:hypothetical protein
MFSSHNVLIQKLRVDIGAIGPNERFQFRIDPDLFECVARFVSGSNTGPHNSSERSMTPAFPSLN